MVPFKFILLRSEQRGIMDFLLECNSKIHCNYAETPCEVTLRKYLRIKRNTQTVCNIELVVIM
jgi:hypothetical protein